MVRKLLLVFAVAIVTSMVCFTILGVIGFSANGPWGNGPWGNGPWGDWKGGWRGWRDAGRDPGPEVTRNLPYSGGDRLEVAFPADITVTQGDPARFTITGPQVLLDELELNDGVLQSRYGPGHGYGWPRRYHGRLTIDVVTPNTHEFRLAGAEKLTIRNYDQDSLILHIAGAADIDAQGRARRLEAHLAGAGHLDMEQLPVQDALVAIAGAGDASIDARASSDVQIFGAGHVQFRCRPANTQSEKPGFGSVDYGPSCSTLPPLAAPAAPSPPDSAAPTPKSKV